MKRKYRNMERGPLPIQLKDNALSVPSLGYFYVDDEQVTGSFRVQIRHGKADEQKSAEVVPVKKPTAPSPEQKALLLLIRSNQERKGDKVQIEKPVEEPVEELVEEVVDTEVEEQPDIPLEDSVVEDEEKRDDTLTKDEESVELDSEYNSVEPKEKEEDETTKKPSKKKRRRQKKSAGQ